ncbi:MAG: thioredoxin domain-containing protein [Chloroflexi bacterium]|nr:thioredoxin domain-containing protein [Chloroflexota bacterium]
MTKRLMFGLLAAVLAAALLAVPGVSRAQDDEAAGIYDWEEFGITLTLPEGWEALPGGQDYDLALASPEAVEGGNGSFVLFTHVPSLGPGVDIDAALAPIAGQVGGEVTPLTVGDLEGAEIAFTDEQSGSAHHLALIPYGTSGQYFYVQSAALSEEDDSVVVDVLSSMTIDPVQPDYAALDTALQTSLSEQESFLLGASDAPVTMVEYLDFACGHCANYSQDVDRLIALHVEPGDVHLELRLLDTVGGDLSNQAAQATYCAAEQGKGYSAYKALFQGYLDQGAQEAYSRDGISDLLSDPDLALDVDALNACVDEGTYAGVIDQSREDASASGVTGTPSVLLSAGGDDPIFLTLPDGQTWAGGVPLAILRPIIDRVIADEVTPQEALDAELSQESTAE